MISVVIPSHDRADKLKNLLESLEKQTYRQFEIIVVSDSTDGTEEMVKEFARKSKIQLRFFRKKSDGPSQKRNIGIKNAKGDIVAFIDDDCVAHSGWLRNISSCFSSSVIGGVEGRTLTGKNIGPFYHYILNESGGEYMTCNIAYRKELLEKIGGFDENFTTPVTINREDSDLAFTALEMGYKIVFARDAKVDHPLVRTSLKNRLKKKREFFVDPLLFRKHPRLYKERIRFPFEKFTPFYIISVAGALFIPLFLLALPLIALIEIKDRKWRTSFGDFLRLIVVQAAGSFVIAVYYLYGCVKFRVNPFAPLIHL